MKKILKDLKKQYEEKIIFAINYGYEGMMVPLFSDDDAVLLETIYNEEELQDMAYECDWNEFLLFDFINDTEKIILSEFA